MAIVNRYKIIICLLCVILLGAFVRFYHLEKVPVALTGDETAFGYNSFAIFKTLKDEYGQFLPLAFKSFGDYKEPVFVYLLAPLTGIFGLSEIVIRFPIAVAGTLLILVTYLISLKIFNSKIIALVAGLMVATSPWAIIFSRGGWEAMLALFITTLALYLSFLSFKRQKWLYPAVILFSIAVYTYHSEKIVVPLLVVSFWLLFKKQLALSLKQFFLLGGILVVFAIPLLVGLTNASGQSRASGSLTLDYLFHSTKDQSYALTANLLAEPDNFIYSWIEHSRVSLSVTDIASKFYAYISPANIFTYGDEVGRHSVVGFGVLYPFDFLFILLGGYFLIKKSKNSYEKLLIIWLFAGLLPAMITMDKLHTIRPLAALPALYIIEAFGLVTFLKYLKDINRKWVVISVLLLAIVIPIYFLRFLQSYFVYTPIERADWWQYGYKQVVQTVAQEQNRFQQVVIDVPPIYGNPYIFFLFYQQYDPTLYNQTVLRKDVPKYKVVEVHGFGKYQFRNINWREDQKLRHVLFVGTDQSIPKNDIRDSSKYRLIKEIFMPDGKTVVFRIVETL
ncbi:MAG: glycosyltransferase family 39 protein [Patescibacteria group bacterium]|nr:glycosyltransferase family 39 protein [Patescibacteria group bacterium]